MTHHPAPAFPVLDADRSAGDTEYRRTIADWFGYTEPRVVEIDSWVSLPTRLCHSQANGWYVELGPYSLDAADIDVLRSAIAAYDRAVGGTA